MTAVKKLTRVFKMGSVRLTDLAPESEPLVSLRLYAANYPHLNAATLLDPVAEGDELIYEVAKPPAKTKG
jgi:PRTRC genetic system protein C